MNSCCRTRDPRGRGSVRAAGWLSEKCGHADGHENAWQVGPKARDVARGWVGRKVLGVGLVQAGEVVRVGQQHTHFDNVVACASARLNDPLSVPKRLLGLLLDGGAGHMTRHRIYPRHPRDPDLRPDSDSLGAQRRVRGTLCRDDLASHRGLP